MAALARAGPAPGRVVPATRAVERPAFELAGGRHHFSRFGLGLGFPHQGSGPYPRLSPFGHHPCGYPYPHGFYPCPYSGYWYGGPGLYFRLG